MKKTIMVFALCALAGCQTVPQVSTNSLRPPPGDAMQPCPAPTPLAGLEMGQVAKKLGETASSLKNCAARHKELIDWVKRGE